MGEDQQQHLELTAKIAHAFNFQYDTQFFTVPIVMLSRATRVMSLRDGTRKMSKSDESDVSRINLTDSEDVIRQKIKRAKTDSLVGVSYDPELRPDVANLLTIYASLENSTPAQVSQQFANDKTSVFKDALAEVIVKHISPIANEVQRLKKDPDFVYQLFKTGAGEANQITSRAIADIGALIGFPKK